MVLHDKIRFADMIKVQTLRLEDDPSLIIGVSQPSTDEFLKVKSLPSSAVERERGMMMEAGSEKCFAGVLEGGGGAESQGIWAASRNGERQVNGFSPTASRKGCSPPSEAHVGLLTHRTL